MNSSTNNWWERFFSGRNELQWQTLAVENASDGWNEDVLPWLELAKSENPDTPLVLPCSDSEGNITWYAGANSDRGSRRLSEELQAFIGPSYSNYNKRPYTLDETDEVESAFAEACSYQVYRFTPSEANQIPKIRRSLALYCGLIERYKAPDLVSTQSFGVIRGEFERALLAGDENEARGKYDQLISTGRLSADNRLYLEIRLLAGLGRWPQIAGDARLLRALSDLVLPPRVLADVIEALYRVYIEPIETSNDPEAALSAFREAGIHRYKRLFAARREIKSPRVLKAFFLYELCREYPDAKRLEPILELLTHESDAFTSCLRKLIPKSTKPLTPLPDRLQEADDAFEDDDFEYALDIYMELPPSPKRLRRMLSCARVIGGLDAARNVLQIIEQEHNADLTTLSSHSHETLELLQKSLEIPDLKPKPENKDWSGEDPRKGWLQWARFVSAGLEPDKARTILHENAVNWDTQSLTKDVLLVTELANLIGNAEESERVIYRDAYSYLFEAFVLEVQSPVRAIKPLLGVLLTNTVLLDGPSQDELELARQLALALMTIGLSDSEYDELVNDLKDMLSYESSLFTLSWALDVAEILSIHPCPKPETRLLFFVMVLDLARRVLHRLSPFHFTLIDLLCRDLQVELPLELKIPEEKEEESEALYKFLVNKRIAIYTLTTQAGKRAALVLKQSCPKVTVDLNNDKVCTERLTAMAKSADIFVFASKSSKHQAFYCVKNHRPDGWPILQPLGKGSSSIIREIVEMAVQN